MLRRLPSCAQGGRRYRKIFLRAPLAPGAFRNTRKRIADHRSGVRQRNACPGAVRDHQKSHPSGTDASRLRFSRQLRRWECNFPARKLVGPDPLFVAPVNLAVLLLGLPALRRWPDRCFPAILGLLQGSCFFRSASGLLRRVAPTAGGIRRPCGSACRSGVFVAGSGPHGLAGEPTAARRAMLQSAGMMIFELRLADERLASSSSVRPEPRGRPVRSCPESRLRGRLFDKRTTNGRPFRGPETPEKFLATSVSRAPSSASRAEARKRSAAPRPDRRLDEASGVRSATVLSPCPSARTPIIVDPLAQQLPLVRIRPSQGHYRLRDQAPTTALSDIFLGLEFRGFTVGNSSRFLRHGQAETQRAAAGFIVENPILLSSADAN